IAFNSAYSVTLRRAAGFRARTAGLKIEANNFGSFSNTVVFRDLANSTLMTVTRSVDGSAGARLFAITCDEELINSMVITAPPAAGGFAIGQIRADSFVVNNGPVGAVTQDPTKVPEGATSNASMK